MASNMTPPSLFKTPEEVAAQSSMNNNDSSAQHVSHLPPVVDPSTASITATKPATLPSMGTIHPGPDTGLVHPAAGIPPSLRTPQGISQEPSDQWAARALDAIAPTEQDKNASPDIDLEYVKQVAADVANTVMQTARTAAGYVQENAPAAAATTRDVAGNAATVVADTTSNAAATVSPIASNAAGAVNNTASNAAGTVSNTMAPVASSVGSTAGGVGSTVREYAATAGDALKPYVPAAVAGVLPSHAPTATGIDSFTGDGVARLPEETRTKGFPSNDDERLTPPGKSAGVGALPGTAQESSVALLPDERLKETGHSHSTRVAPFHKEVTLKGDGVPSSLPQRDAPEVSSHAPVSSLDKPTSLAPTGLDASGGASETASTKVLPGSKKQSKEGLNAGFHGIGEHDPANHHPRTHMGATLAEINSERHELGHPPADNRPPHVPPKDRVDSDLATTGHGAGLTANSFTSVDNGLSSKSGAYTTTDTAGRESAGDRTKDTTAGVTSGAGNATTAPGLSMGHTAGVHPETHPTYGKDDGSKASAAGNNTLGKTSSPSEDSTDSKGEKKPGFMSKLKGEVKVISGKLGHNEAKIEEGRRMMGKN